MKKLPFVNYISYWTNNGDKPVHSVQSHKSPSDLPRMKASVAVFGKAINAINFAKLMESAIGGNPIDNPETVFVSEWTTDNLTPSFIFDDGDGWEVSYR